MISQVPSEAATPINDLGTGLYLDQFQGGLYPDGTNQMPVAHAAAGLVRAAAIRPLNPLGDDDPNGKYAMVSIGMSNNSQEFCTGEAGSTTCNPWTFMGQAAVDPVVNHESLVLINGAQGGETAEFWNSPDDENYDRIVSQWLTPKGLSEQQVQVAWLKVVNPLRTISLPDQFAEAYHLTQQLGDIVRSMKERYPHLQQVFLSSRTYAGYASVPLSPEPYAYESGFAVKWLIEAQIKQMLAGSIDPLAGDLNYQNGTAPWLAWGPYLWADGMNPRSDGLIWEPGDFEEDGTHPSTAGEEKVADLLLNQMLNSPFTKPWFATERVGDFNHDGEVNDEDLGVWQLAYGVDALADADADGDGDSDGRDFLAWQREFGSGANNPADFDLDGDVDGRDFLVWQRGGSPSPFSAGDLGVWQSQYAGGGPLVSPLGLPPSPLHIAVPEPSAILLAGIAIALFMTATPRAAGQSRS